MWANRPDRLISACTLLLVALSPAVLGYVIARWIPSLWTWSPFFWGVAFIGGWFIVGRYLARMGYGYASIMAGVIPPLLGVGLFVQQFYLTSGADRSHNLSLWGQLYPMIAISPVSEMLRLFGVSTIDSRVAILLAYATMMGAFILGSLSEQSRAR
ncbi:MAG: hypothetical protein R6U70_01090 [Bacillota bacterium]